MAWRFEDNAIYRICPKNCENNYLLLIPNWNSAGALFHSETGISIVEITLKKTGNINRRSTAKHHDSKARSFSCTPQNVPRRLIINIIRNMDAVCARESAAARARQQKCLVLYYKIGTLMPVASALCFLLDLNHVCPCA